jgi:hypothetical protein
VDRFGKEPKPNGAGIIQPYPANFFDNEAHK